MGFVAEEKSHSAQFRWLWSRSVPELVRMPAVTPQPLPAKHQLLRAAGTDPQRHPECRASLSHADPRASQLAGIPVGKRHCW